MKRILVDAKGSLILVALTDENKLTDLLVSPSEGEGSLVGHIYAGTVKNILPGEFGFIDIGARKNAFLHLSDSKERGNLPDSGQLRLKRGQPILVQVLKDATNQKGAYVTTQISLPGKLMVLHQSPIPSVSVSKKIEDKRERARLKTLAQGLLPPGYGIVFRTDSQDKDSDELIREFSRLKETLDNILATWMFKRPPSLLFGRLEPIEKAVDELLKEDVEEIIVNTEPALSAVKALDNKRKLSLYQDELPLFDRYRISGQINEAMGRRVNFGGGYMIIEQTEACSVVDINSGSYLGEKNHESSALHLNLSAIVPLCRQLRLRNLSGIIIVDFIDMKLDENRRTLKSALMAELKKDRIPATLADDAALGLYLITRKKTREPLGALLTKTCHLCGGTGKLMR